MKLSLLRLADDDAARSSLEALANNPRTDTTGGTSSGCDVLADAQLIGVEQMGERVMTLAIAAGRQVPLRELWILGAVGGNPRAPILPAVIDLVEREAALSFDVIAVQTKRRGLIAQLKSRGYSADAVTLRKRLHAVH